MPFNVTTTRPNGLNKLITFEPDIVDTMEPDIPVYMIAASSHITSYVNTPAIQLIYDANPDIRETYPTFVEYFEYVNKAGGFQELYEMLPALKAIPEFQFEITSIFDNLDSYVDTALSRAAMHFNLRRCLYRQHYRCHWYNYYIYRYLKNHPKKIRRGGGVRQGDWISCCMHAAEIKSPRV